MKNMNKYFLGSLLLVLIATGCALHKQSVVVTPNQIAATPCAVNGQGQSFYLVVADEREDLTIGHRSNAYGKAGEIKTEGDVIATFRDGLTQGFQRCGYTILTQPPPVAPVYTDPSVSMPPLTTGQLTLPPLPVTPTVKVELRQLNYDTTVGFWSGKIIVKGAAKVAVKRGDHEDWSTMKRTEMAKKRMFVPTAKKNALWINETFNELIRQIVNEPVLASTLASLKNYPVQNSAASTGVQPAQQPLEGQTKY